jgi:anti-anti-sigma factor
MTLEMIDTGAPRPHTMRIVRLEGEVDLATSAAMRDKLLAEIAEPGCHAVLVDCLSLRLLSACGMDAMLDVQRFADAIGIALAWSRLPPVPLRSIRLLGLDRELRIIA